MVLWMLSIAVSVACLVIAAGAGALVPVMVNVHMMIAALIATVFALIAFRDTRQLIREGHSRTVVAASVTRFMGLVWAWGALVLIVTYGTGILTWSEWWKFFLAFMVVSGLCLFLSATMKKDASENSEDEFMLRVGQLVALVTVFSMLLTAGFIGFGRLGGLEDFERDAWAANHVFLFGAIALMAISAYALKASAEQAE